jgi:response regulator RpfG family c-di-GMP phosphodiesterase
MNADGLSASATDWRPMHDATESFSPKVLIVDDDPSFRRLLEFILADAKIENYSAVDGDEALKKLARERFSVVLCDLNMPGISGRQVLDAVRDAYPHVAFFIVTGQGEVDVAVELMRLGADDYLVKPFEPAVVLASIERGLKKKRLEMELQNYRLHLEQMVSDRTEQLQAALARTEQSYDETLEALGSAIDLRDNETAGHSRRVCLYSFEIAKIYGCSSADFVTLGRGAWLHDIGKLAVPDSILLKPGPLTGIEWITMQSHVSIGYELVSKISFLADAAEIVLHHHERYDGTGYLQKLAAEKIPLTARIFSIADAFDAMTSPRPYQERMSFEAAKCKIRSGASAQFDPTIVDSFLSIPVSVWFDLREQTLRPRNLRHSPILRTTL